MKLHVYSKFYNNQKKCIWLSGQDFTRQEETSGGRQRLEVTEIKVRPQLAQDFQGNLSMGSDNCSGAAQVH